MLCTPLKISEKQQSDTFFHKELPAISVSLSYPLIESDLTSSFTKKVNHFYKKDAVRLLSYIKKELLPEAGGLIEQALSQSRPLPECFLKARFSVTENTEHCVSLYRDFTIFTDRTYTVRLSESWSRKTGCPVFLSDFFPWRKSAKKQALRCLFAEHHIPEKQKKYFRRYLKAESFYLQDGSLCLYYQPGTVAPPENGVSEYCIKKDVY